MSVVYLPSEMLQPAHRGAGRAAAAGVQSTMNSMRTRSLSTALHGTQQFEQSKQGVGPQMPQSRSGREKGVRTDGGALSVWFVNLYSQRAPPNHLDESRTHFPYEY